MEKISYLKSDKQRRYLFANEPKLAKKWSNMYGKKIVGLGGVDNEKKNFKKLKNSLPKYTRIYNYGWFVMYKKNNKFYSMDLTTGSKKRMDVNDFYSIRKYGF